MDNTKIYEIENEASDVLYKYIEFFFSKEELNKFIIINTLTCEMYLDSVYDLYSKKPSVGENVFHYNIRHTTEYETIMSILKEIKKQIADKTKEVNIEVINSKLTQIEELYKKLHYYDKLYVYAHYVFNNIRSSEIIQLEENLILGGGVTIEHFKQMIRDKIKKI